jgi:hypothetical protein
MASFVDIQITQDMLSNSTGNDREDESLIDTLLTIVNFYIPCVVLSLGFIGNTMAFIIMTQRLRKHQNVVMSYHFRALALGDNGVVTLGFGQRLVLSNVPDVFENYGDFFCKEFNYILFVFFGVHVWNVIIISIDRFVAVCFPLKAAMWCTLRKARVCYAFNLCFHLAFSSVKLWKRYQKYPTNLHTEVCINPPEFPSWFENFFHMFYYVIVNYASPLIVLVLNVSILIKFRRQGKELQNMAEKGISQKKENQERNLTLMMMVVAFSFIFLLACYPFEDIVWNYLIPHVAKAYPKLRELSFYTFYYVTGLNPCLNFYIYMLVSDSFRKDFIRLFDFASQK